MDIKQFAVVCEPPNGWHSDEVLANEFTAFESVVAKLSPTQQDVIEKLILTGAALCRVPGGFWTWDGCPVNAAGHPAWWVTIQTVRAMEKNRMLKRDWFYVEEWKDHRSLAVRS